MSFDYRKEFAKFKSDWEKQETIMREAGMSEETIAELYNFSYKQFKGDRNYALKICDYTSVDGKGEMPNGKKPRQGMAEQSLEFDECLDLIEQIENPALIKALKELSKEQYELLCLYVVQGFLQTEIARITKQSKQNVSNKMNRIKKIIKSFF